mmetsp:Transcript_589/g.928  ORF Transcript_589/g.928 Transcript_589/m.928 type:complete len:1025 (-) Transcript_589:6917-9991(-)
MLLLQAMSMAVMLFSINQQRILLSRAFTINTVTIAPATTSSSRSSSSTCTTSLLHTPSINSTKDGHGHGHRHGRGGRRQWSSSSLNRNTDTTSSGSGSGSSSGSSRTSTSNNMIRNSCYLGGGGGGGGLNTFNTFNTFTTSSSYEYGGAFTLTHSHIHTSTSTLLNAVESRELRFLNSSPLDEKNVLSVGGVGGGVGGGGTTTTSTTTTSMNLNTNVNTNINTNTAVEVKETTNDLVRDCNNGSGISNNSSKSNSNSSTSTSTHHSNHLKTLDLSHQVSYFTSLFQKSNFYINNNWNNNNNSNNNNNNNGSNNSSNNINENLNNLNRLFFSTSSSSQSSSISSSSSGNDNNNHNHNHNNMNNFQKNTGLKIDLTPEEQELFDLLAQVIKETDVSSTLRVAGGWVRDKLLATEEFQRRGSGNYINDSMMKDGGKSSSTTGLVERLTSKYRGPSIGRQGTKLIGLPKQNGSTSSPGGLTLLDPKDLPVDIDIALDDMLGREFADHLNDWLTQHGQETISVGVVLKNPEKSKHLETATMKVGKFWIDFVNLRAEEYTEDSRIPDLMRIGTAEEDAFRRDLTINALFYNINTGQVEDFTGRGFDDLKRGVIATPLPALTTLLDDPLRVLRSVRFAARLRFTMEESLKKAAKDERVRIALAQKVARERIGAEVDLMLRSQDPVGAMRLLINLNLAGTVFSIKDLNSGTGGDLANLVFTRGLNLLSTTHDHLVDCKVNVPIWCEKKRVTAAATNGVNEVVLMEDEELRRKLWYASFLKPLRDHCQMMRPIEKEKVGRRQGKKARRSVIMKIMVDELKRPVRDAEAVEAIMKGADDFSNLLNAGCNLSSTACLLSEIRILRNGFGGDNSEITCLMGEKVINSELEDDPVWQGAMEYRLLVSKVLKRLGPLWRAAMVLSLSEQLAVIEGEELSYTIEGDVFEEAQEEKRIGVVQTYDTFAASLLQLGLVGIWSQQPLIDGKEMKSHDILPNIPKGPVFRVIMEEQEDWMTTHPGGSKEALVRHLREIFHDYI